MSSVFGSAAPIGSFVSSLFFSNPESLTDEQKRLLDESALRLRGDIANQIEALKLAMKSETSQTNLKDTFDAIKSYLKTECKAILSQISSAQQREAAVRLNETRDALERDLAELPLQIKMVKKLRDQGFPQELAVTHPSFVRFIFESKLAFWISCFRNSTEMGPQNHGVKLSATGEPMLKMNGSWQTWEHIQAVIRYDEESEKLVSKNNYTQSWTYVSPQGLIQKDRFDYTEIYPIEEVSEVEYARLLQHSKKFYDNNPELDVGVEKEAIYQVVTTYRTKWWGVEIPDNWMTKNLLKTMPRHVTLRIIDKDRKVYSFGFEMKKEESDLITSFLPPTILKTATTHISVPDYEEPRPFEERVTTNVPLTSARAKQILDFVTHHNTQGIRFNFMKQNCTKLTGETLALAGYRIDTRISFGNFWSNFLPNMKDVPIIGVPMDWVMKKILYVVRPILNAMITYTPAPIKQVVRYIPEKIATILINLFIWVLGGASMTSPLPEGVEDERDNATKLGRFSRIIRSPLDIFRDDTCDINYSQAIVDWQMRQNSTVTAEYDGKPQLNLHPTREVNI